MSEFDAFESASPAPQEEDPAADFLAREQNQLAELEDNNFGVGAPDDEGFIQEMDSEVMKEFDSMLGGYEAVPDGKNTTKGKYGQPQAPQDVYAEVSRVDQQRQEPEKIRKWREEQKEMLEKKDAAAEDKKAEWRKIAQQELEDWYKHRAEQHEKFQKSNREGETEFLKERDEVTPGHEWERICRNCDFSPKGSRNQKDVSRMRSILLQLKQSPLVR